jgi:hypothetical protein
MKCQRNYGPILFKAIVGSVVFICLTSRTYSDSITQTADFYFANNGTNFQYYQPFDPALGTLSEVIISYSGTANIGYEVSMSNSGSGGPNSYSAYISATLTSDAGAQEFTGSYTNLPSAALITAAGSVSLSEAFTGDLTRWIATSQPIFANLPPLLHFSSVQVGSYDPNITIYASAEIGMIITGSENITYNYMPFLSIPEPSSWVELVVGALVVRSFWLLRARAKAPVAKSLPHG